jgi:SAM-dependent methyltransferase
MKNELSYTLIDGIRCYNADVANTYEDYPEDGFDLMDNSVESSFWVDSRTRLFKRLVIKYRSSKKRTKYLEIGCANGDFIRHLEGLDWLDITGSEVYLKGLINAKKISNKSEYIQYDVTKGVLEERYDMITAFDVIEHLEDDDLALHNINEMLEDDGVLLISVPQYMFLWSRLDEIVMHKRRYSKKRLIDGLKSNGFIIEYCTSFVFLLFPLMLLSRLFDKKKNHDDVTLNSEELQRRVNIPSALNVIFDNIVRIDERLINLGLSLPFGGTLIVVARKGGG